MAGGKFEKGHVPWHAGTKGKVKPRKHAFKKGGTPKNKVAIGTITERKRGKFIKTEGGWKQYNKYLWEQKHGAVPRGMSVVMVDSELKLYTKQQILEMNTDREKAKEAYHKILRREQLRKKYGLSPLTGLGERMTNYY